MTKCIDKYLQIEDSKPNAEDNVKNRYFEKLWNLHFEQYTYFINGFLLSDLYVNWLWHRNKQYNNSAEYTEQAAQWGRISKDYIDHDPFTKFMNEVLVPGRLKDDIKRLIEKEACSPGRVFYLGECLFILIFFALLYIYDIAPDR